MCFLADSRASITSYTVFPARPRLRRLRGELHGRRIGLLPLRHETGLEVAVAGLSNAGDHRANRIDLARRRIGRILANIPDLEVEPLDGPFVLQAGPFRLDVRRHPGGRWEVGALRLVLGACDDVLLALGSRLEADAPDAVGRLRLRHLRLRGILRLLRGSRLAHGLHLIDGCSPLGLRLCRRALDARPLAAQGVPRAANLVLDVRSRPQPPPRVNRVPLPANPEVSDG